MEACVLRVCRSVPPPPSPPRAPLPDFGCPPPCPEREAASVAPARNLEVRAVWPRSLRRVIVLFLASRLMSRTRGLRLLDGLGASFRLGRYLLLLVTMSARGARTSLLAGAASSTSCPEREAAPAVLARASEVRRCAVEVPAGRDGVLLDVPDDVSDSLSFVSASSVGLLAVGASFRWRR